jgi:hypothetical protein
MVFYLLSMVHSRHSLLHLGPRFSHFLGPPTKTFSFSQALSEDFRGSHDTNVPQSLVLLTTGVCVAPQTQEQQYLRSGFAAPLKIGWVFQKHPYW